jgi:hypothetical protein
MQRGNEAEFGGFAWKFADFRETKPTRSIRYYANWREGSFCEAADVVVRQATMNIHRR